MQCIAFSEVLNKKHGGNAELWASYSDGRLGGGRDLIEASR